MATLLLVHHTVSPATQELLEAALSGTSADGLESVEVDVHPALSATAADVLAADGFLLGTPANIGYLSGAMKYFFDNIYYPCLNAKTGAPYGIWLHGDNDTGGALRAAESITKAMGWKQVHEPVAVTGAVTKQATDAVWDLAATVAASLVA
jgi:multimeric flavodoxin WrbA